MQKVFQVIGIGMWMWWGAGFVLAAGPYVDEVPGSGLPSFQEGTSFGIDGNIALLDADGDGDVDVVFGNDGTPSLLFFENKSVPGSPLFQERTAEVGLVTNEAQGIGFAAGDVNGDGWDDLYVATDERDILFINQGGTGFENETQWRLPGYDGFSSSVAMGDPDGDGDLDIYVSRYVRVVSWPFHIGERDSLLLNDGTGRFTEAPAGWGVGSSGCGLSSMWTDVDEDGDSDLIVVNDFGSLNESTRVMRNDGPVGPQQWAWTDISEASGLGRTLYGMGVAAFDSDRDGHLDYYYTSIGRDVLMRGLGNGAFEDVTDARGLGGTWSATGYRTKWAPLPLDMDGDGWDDLYVRTGYIAAYWFILNPWEQADLVYVFDSDGNATNASTLFSTPAMEVGRGAVASDFDGDGAVDILAGSTDDDPLRLFRASVASPTLRLQLVSTVSAPGATGARATLTCPGVVRVAEKTSSGGFGSAPLPGELWLGVPPQCEEAWTLSLQWPSGHVDVLEGAGSGATLVMEEAEWWQWSQSEGSPSLRIRPAGTDGEPLGAGLLVEAGLPGDVQPLQDKGDGWYERVFSWEGGGQHLQIVIDGKPMAAHPALPYPTGESNAAFYPAVPVQGSSIALVVQTDGALGQVLALEGLSMTGVEQVGGYQVFSFNVALDAETVSVVVGEEGGAGWSVERSAAVTPSPNPETLLVTIDAPFKKMTQPPPQESIKVEIRPVDQNGSEVVPADMAFDLVIDGEVVDTDVAAGPGAPISLNAVSTEYEAGDLLEVRVGDKVVVGPVMIHGYETAADLFPFIDVDKSDFGSSYDNCRADGMDRVAFLFRPRTSEGYAVPMKDLEGELVVGGDGFFMMGTLDKLGKFMEGEVRCGDVAGQGLVSLDGLLGAEIGVTLPITLRELEPLPPVVADLSSWSPLQHNGAGQGTWILNFRPRDKDDNLIGSGLNVAILLNEGEACIPLSYCGLGKYCYTALLPDGEHTGVILVNGEPLDIPVFFDQGDEGAEDWSVNEPAACMQGTPGEGGEGGGDSDTEEPDTEEPDTEEPDTQEPDTQEPDTQEPDTQEPDTQEPDTQEPDTQEPDTGLDTSDLEDVLPGDETDTGDTSTDDIQEEPVDAGTTQDAHEGGVSDGSVTLDDTAGNVDGTAQADTVGTEKDGGFVTGGVDGAGELDSMEGADGGVASPSVVDSGTGGSGGCRHSSGAGLSLLWLMLGVAVCRQTCRKVA